MLFYHVIHSHCALKKLLAQGTMKTHSTTFSQTNSRGTKPWLALFSSVWTRWQQGDISLLYESLSGTRGIVQVGAARSSPLPHGQTSPLLQQWFCAQCQKEIGFAAVANTTTYFPILIKREKIVLCAANSRVLISSPSPDLPSYSF